MDCDRSALLKKAIKATARRLKNKHALAVAFFAFWAINLCRNKREVTICLLVRGFLNMSNKKV